MSVEEFFADVTWPGMIVGIVLTFIVSFGWDGIDRVIERRHKRRLDREEKLQLTLYGGPNHGMSWPGDALAMPLEDIDEGGEGEVRLSGGGIQRRIVTRDVKAYEILKAGDLEVLNDSEPDLEEAAGFYDDGEEEADEEGTEG